MKRRMKKEIAQWSPNMAPICASARSVTQRSRLIPSARPVALSSCLTRVVGSPFNLLEQCGQTLRQRCGDDDVCVFGAEPLPNLQQPFAVIRVVVTGHVEFEGSLKATKQTPPQRG